MRSAAAHLGRLAAVQGREGDAHVDVDGVHEWRGAGHDPEADARGQDLGEAVEAEHAADVRLLEFQGKVRCGARRRAIVEIVVRVIWGQGWLCPEVGEAGAVHTLENYKVVLSGKLEDFFSPFESCGHPCWIASELQGIWFVLARQFDLSRMH